MTLHIKNFTNNKMTLKDTLNDLLDQRGMNLSGLAKETGIAVQTLHNWLSGIEPKSLSQVKIVADYFGVSIDFLCFRGSRLKSTKTDHSNEIEDYSDEINAGLFEVVLRRVNKNK